MFKGPRRGGFMVATPLNTPIVMHKIGKTKHVSKDEILSFLDKFITEKESLEGITSTPATTEDSTTSSTSADTTTTTSVSAINIDTNLSSAVSQLKRIQRDFKGLPPQSFAPVVAPAVTNTAEATTETTEHGEETVTKSATGGKKVTFDE
ncbi:hypothetical protein C6P45_001701 [Maudiozyma exigua]|uniref:DNA-directed RNA polymerase I subunit RPA14 n=1 Tax=Maudiozyma exigua TaxID=34358 RepID=A0A9P6W208_MAUEX|nr:hypothetical protein C6P45_001701 [Kazachstania exigua]